MITLEQIQVLDKKIKDAIELINRLREEKSTLKTEIAAHEETIARLESELSSYRSDSEKIEEGFIDALSRLEQVDGEESTVPVQQEQEELTIEPHTGEDDVLIEEDVPVQEDTVVESGEFFANEEEETAEEPVQEEEPAAEEMQFEAAAEITADQPASEEPDIDGGIPLTSEEEEESQVNHSEQQDEEESRSPQDLDIF